MNERAAGRLAWSLWGLTMAIAAVGVATLIVSLDSPRPPGLFGFVGFPELFALVFGTTGAIVASRRPANPIGWILLAMGITAAIEGVATYTAIWAMGEGNRPGLGAWGAWLVDWVWIPLTGALGLIFLVFPNGHALSRGWRRAGVVAVGGIAAATVANALVNPLTSFPGTPNPIWRSPIVFGDVAASGLLLYLMGLGVATASLVARYRRSVGDERQQMKWLALAASTMTLGVAFYGALSLVAEGGEASQSQSTAWFDAVLILSFLSIPISIGIAILRYRLYDIDVVINKAVAYGALGVFITLVYVAIVVGVGTAIGSGGNTVLSAVAAAVVALAFQPARRRAQRLANRLVYGKRATPYEVLSELSSRFAGAYSIEDALPRLAHVTAEAVGADRSRVWLRNGSELRPVASWPDAQSAAPRPIRGDSLPVIEGETAFPVRHQGELLGAVTVGMPANEALGAAQEKLLHDVAAHAGLVLRNVSLVEDLRSSRKRIVTAQDDRARAIERNIHDGAQQQLVALAVQLRLAEQLIERDPAGARQMLGQLHTATNEALQDLRDLARGIYPPLLADKGLAAALESQVRRAAIPTTVETDGIGRYPADVEATVYFCVLEALSNAAKYSEAGAVRVALQLSNGELSVEVRDDGRGFDPSSSPSGSGLQGMADRVAAIGGMLEVSSTPGEGTVVKARVPVGAVS